MSKTIDKMNCLSDMGKLPWHVNLGASFNILFTIYCTRIFHQVVGGEIIFLIPFALAFLFFNLLPVVFLRLKERNTEEFPLIEQMNFFRDQHRFSTWVYAIASGNMFFWITVAWCLFSYSASVLSLSLLLLLAFFVTYVPAWRGVIS